MALKCCNVSQKSDGFYFINHSEQGRTKVNHAKCVKCKNLILDVQQGIFNTNTKCLTGKEARKFNRDYPQPVYKPLVEKTEDFRQFKKDTARGFRYLDGKTMTIKNLSTDNIDFNATLQLRDKKEVVSIC